jgi:hypothetical protein
VAKDELPTAGVVFQNPKTHAAAGLPGEQNQVQLWWHVVAVELGTV